MSSNNAVNRTAEKLPFSVPSALRAPAAGYGDTTAGWCYGIRAVQELPGHGGVRTTMVRSHVPIRGPSA